ncbi:MAG: oligosaccharide flippase family protein [Planctomycetes bacterium]|nr:oligosaccharide flippase family protein [Planctomycetota bacterium]
MNKVSAKTIGSAGLGKLIAKYLPGQITPSIIAFFALPFLTRLFTKDQYGYYILILATVTTVSSLGFSWVQNCALRFYRSLEEDLAKYFFHLFCSTVLTVIVIAAIGTVAWLWLPGKYRGILLISAPLTVFLGTATVLSSVLLAQSKAVAFSVFKGLTAFVRFLPGIVVLVWISSEVKSFVIAWTIGAFAVVVFLVILTRAGQGLLVQKPDKNLLGEFFHYGIPITVVSLMGIIMTTIDRYLIDVFRSPSELAVYGVSYQLGSMSILLIGHAIMMAVLPRAIDTYEGGHQYADVASRGLRYFLLVSFSVLSIVGVAAPEILEVYAGPGYNVGGNVLRLVMVAVFVMSLTHYFRMPFLVNRRTSTLLLIGAGPAILSIVLNLILIPLYGSLGGALTLLLSYSLMLIMSIYYSRRIVRIKWPVVTIARCLMATVVVLVVAWVTRQFLVLNSLVVLGLVMTGWMLVYLLVLYVSGEIKGEVDYLRKFFRDRIQKHLI